MNDQYMPLVARLAEVAGRREAVFCTPGHKKGKGVNPIFQQLLGEAVFRHDLPELPELDNLFHPSGVIQQAQQLAAETFGASYTWFLANGTTCGIIAAIMATCGEGEKIILPRNVHQSAIFGLILSGATPVFLTPTYDADFDLCYNLSPRQIANALAANPDASAVLLVSPTYHGICANLTAIAHSVHHYNIPLIVDEAHGAHFAFHPSLPKSALACGADIVVQSTHKVLGAMTQAAMLHLQGNIVNPESITASLQLVQSSSPNYLLLASLDAARSQMAAEGEALMAKTLQLASLARNSLRQLDYLSVLELRQTRDDFFHLDSTRLTVKVASLGLTGYQADDILRSLGVVCELPALKTLTFIISLGNSHQDIEILVNSLRQLTQYQQTTKPSYLPPPIPNPHLVMTPRQAFFAKKKTRVKLSEAVNHVSCETICPYPPGIPLILPGELISQDTISYLQEIIHQGGTITGITDTTLQTLLVVAQ